MTDKQPTLLAINPVIDGQEYVPARLDAIPLGHPLPFPIYLFVAGKLTCFRNSGDTLTKERRVPLVGRVDTIYIPLSHWTELLKTLETFLDQQGLSTQERADGMHGVLFAYSRYLEETRHATKSLIGKIRGCGYRLAETVKTDPALIPLLLKRNTDSNLYHANHAVNVAMYALAMGLKLGMKVEDLRELAFASLVHNVGNIIVPRDLLYKEGEISKDELKALQGHAYQGAQLLEYLDAPTPSVLTARHHHERMDGQGYPFGLVAAEIHVFAKICTIADVYDALLSSKPHGQNAKKIMSPTEVVEQMRSMKGKFDPSILSMIETK